MLYLNLQNVFEKIDAQRKPGKIKKKKFFKSQLLGPFLKLIKMFNGPERFKKFYEKQQSHHREITYKKCAKNN